jgi:hypothetical protein
MLIHQDYRAITLRIVAIWLHFYGSYYAGRTNSSYGTFADSDCTNFVSQALKAGDLADNNTWYFRAAAPGGNATRCVSPLEAYIASQFGIRTFATCGSAWALTDNLYNNLLERGFHEDTINGSILAKNWSPDDIEHSNRVNAHGLVIPSPMQLENYGNFNFSAYHIRRGDVVFYRQEHAAHIAENPNGNLFNHAGIVVDENAPLTYLFKGKQYNEKFAPVIAEHSGGYGDHPDQAIPILYGTINAHSINDTWSEVNKIVVVHIPDIILVEETNPCP